MNFFDFVNKMYDPDSEDAIAMDDALSESATQAARENTGKAEHGTEKSAKQIAEYSKAGKILSAEELIEHRKHCRAKPGNCPFEKAVDEADDITPNEIRVTKQDVFNRLASVLTQLFQVAKNLAKPAIAEPEAVEEKMEVDKAEKSAQDTGVNVYSEAEKTTQDNATIPNEPNTDAKMVAEIIEGGIEKMVELAKSKGCIVDMDENNTKYIVRGPEKTSAE